MKNSPIFMREMSNWIIDCSEPWFSLLKNGEKKVEGRKRTSKWIDIQAGDTVTFRNGKDTFTKRVIGITTYSGENSLRDYLIAEGLDRALPGVTSIDEGERIYLQWSTKEEIAQYGFMGIQV